MDEKNERVWTPLYEEKPAANQIVMARLIDHLNIGSDNDEEEPAHVFFCPIHMDEEGKWHVEPPYEKYNVSIFIDKDKLLPGVVITHWSEIMDEELDSWKNRFDLKNHYDHLTIKGDTDSEFRVYKAAKGMIGLMNMVVDSTPDMNEDLKNDFIEFRNTMHDILSIINLGGDVNLV